MSKVSFEKVNHIDKYLNPGSILATDYELIIESSASRERFMIIGSRGVEEALRHACSAFELYLKRTQPKESNNV